MSRRRAETGLSKLYENWNNKNRIWTDRSRPYEERLIAYRWVYEHVLGEECVPDDMEADTDRLLEMGLGF